MALENISSKGIITLGGVNVKKFLLIIIGSMLFISACGQIERKITDEDVQKRIEEKAANSEKAEEKSDEPEPTQEELNEMVMAEAVEVDFVKANRGEYGPKTRLKATGEVSFKDDLEFTLSTKEGDGYGMYLIKYANTTDAEFEDGDIVTVYGGYYKQDEDTSMPVLSVTVIEPVE